MKRNTPNAIKKHFHNWLVRIICALPKFQKGPIEEIQAAYEMFSREAHKSWQARQPPHGGNIRLESIRILEVFDIDHNLMLTQGLRRLFPSCKRAAELADQREQIAGAISNGSWHKIGVLTKSSSMRWKLFGDRQIVDTLPPCVEAIDVSYQSILPSLSAVSFDLHMSDAATAKLRHAIDGIHDPGFVFNRWWPFHRQMGFSVEYGDMRMAQAYASAIDALRMDSARWISRYLRGMYFNKNNIREGRIPAAYTFKVFGCPTDPESQKEWYSKNRRWLDAYRATSMLPSFEIDNISIILPEDWKGPCDAPCRIVVRDIPNDNNRRSPRHILDGLLGYQAVEGYITSCKRIIEGARMPVYSSMAHFKAQIRRKALSRVFEVQHCRHLLGRTQMELNSDSGGLAFCMMTLGGVYGEKKYYNDKSLAQVALDEIKQTLRNILEHADYMEKALSETIYLQNIRAMLRLGRDMKYLAVAGLVFSALQIVVYRRELVEYFKTLLHYLESIL